MATAVAEVDVEIVTGPKKGFIVQKRRWVVERSFAWFGRSRRVCEAVLETISAMTYAASVSPSCGASRDRRRVDVFRSQTASKSDAKCLWRHTKRFTNDTTGKTFGTERKYVLRLGGLGSHALFIRDNSGGGFPG